MLNDDEIADRLRRIETRLTTFMEFMGFDTQTRKPFWKSGAVHIPSPDCSLKAIMLAVPPSGSDRWVPIIHKGEVVCAIAVGGNYG